MTVSAGAVHKEESVKTIFSIFISLVLCIPRAEARAQSRTEAGVLQKASASGILNLTLQEAVRMALENNPALKVEKIRVEQARSRIEGQLGDYNTVFNSS